MSNVNKSVFFKRHDLKFNVMVGWIMDHLRTPELFNTVKRKVKVAKEFFTNTLNAEMILRFFLMANFRGIDSEQCNSNIV